SRHHRSSCAQRTDARIHALRVQSGLRLPVEILRAYIKWLKAIVVLSVLLVAGLHIGAWSIDSWSAPRASSLPARSPIALNDLQQALDTEFAPVVKDGLLRPPGGCGVAIGIIDHGQR